jgi:hypothetical protein
LDRAPKPRRGIKRLAWRRGGRSGRKGKHEVVQRAAGVLASNPSVSLEGRDFLVGQLQGLLGAKKK